MQALKQLLMMDVIINNWLLKEWSHLRNSGLKRNNLVQQTMGQTKGFCSINFLLPFIYSIYKQHGISWPHDTKQY